jgi:nicotinate-nucleotide--dimethylbenzimidazole phosphoribosyltransferase
MNPVPAPALLAEPPADLGRLGAALQWLAATQGAWPPHPPALPRRLLVAEGSGLDAGIAQADALADAGVDLLVLDGPPATPAALLVLAALLDLEPVMAVGTASGADWAATVVAVRDGLPEARSRLGDIPALVADPLIGHLTGLLAQAAVRRTPVLLGPSAAVAAAALAADRLAPAARRWWLAATAPAATAPGLAYAELALEPLLDLGLTAPGATGLAADLLVGAIALTG